MVEKCGGKGAKNSLPKSPFSAAFSIHMGCSFHKLVDVYTSLSSHMDSSTRDNWAYLAWDGVQRKGEELTEQFSNRVMVSMMASRQDGLYRGTQTR